MLNDSAAAIADYNRAIAESPKGYYLKAELTARIIAVHTKAKTLPALLADYQRDVAGEVAWPLRVGDARPALCCDRRARTPAIRARCSRR